MGSIAPQDGHGSWCKAANRHCVFTVAERFGAAQWPFVWPEDTTTAAHAMGWYRCLVFKWAAELHRVYIYSLAESSYKQTLLLRLTALGYAELMFSFQAILWAPNPSELAPWMPFVFDYEPVTLHASGLRPLGLARIKEHCMSCEVLISNLSWLQDSCFADCCIPCLFVLYRDFRWLSRSQKLRHDHCSCVQKLQDVPSSAQARHLCSIVAQGFRPKSTCIAIVRIVRQIRCTL
jgi:hypothetical protein